MGTDLGFVTGIEWMPRVDDLYRLWLEDGAVYSLDERRDIITTASEDASPEAKESYQRFIKAAEKFWRERAYSPGDGVTVIVG